MEKVPGFVSLMSGMMFQFNYPKFSPLCISYLHFYYQLCFSYVVSLGYADIRGCIKKFPN
jgi:hypothetical protein